MGLLGKIFSSKLDKSNIYGIDKKEYKEIKADLKRQNIKFKKSELKAAINNRNLEAYLENVGTEMKNALGLSLTPKLNLTEDQMARLSEFGHNFTTRDATFEDLQAAVKMLEGNPKAQMYALASRDLDPKKTEEHANTAINTFNDYNENLVSYA